MDLNNIYHQKALTEVNRLLSMQNREPFSVTSGCFDRTYWCWKFTDFPGARFQEGIYSLAHLYKNNFLGNDLFSNKVVLDWIESGFKFWKKIQYSDGSFDEAYPYERSLAAVGFTNFYLGEAYRLVEKDLSENLKIELIETFSKSGNWLIKNDELHGVLTNHLAAAAAALLSIYKITGSEEYKVRMNYFLNRIFKKQSKEGWYEEYGGFDPGYQTHAIFYLARIWQQTRDPLLEESLNRSINFLKYFIHPDATLGGEYSSRGTEFYYPAGLEIFSEVSDDSKEIAGFMKKSVQESLAAGLSAMDPYNFFPLLNNYLFAAINDRSQLNRGEALPFFSKHNTYFSDAGILVNSNESYYAVFGASKGGTIKVFSKISNENIVCDAGYIAESNTGIYSSQSFSKEHKTTLVSGGIVVSSMFFRTSQKIMKPWLFLGFRFFSLTLGRVPLFSYWLKNILVKALVKKKVKAPITLERRVCFFDQKIEVLDKIALIGDIKLCHLSSFSKFSTIHMGSSRYFQKQELKLNRDFNSIDKAKELMLSRALEINRSIDL
ncbi:MAG: hypothetical protein M9962_05900 [Oligoflexia bacterium]|nr:hypothetical protein [Oligoflexia bacterium]